MPLPPDDLVGRTLGHYRVVALVGEGGMAVVYKAFDENLHRTIALKVLPEKAVREDSERRSFLREARSAAAVSHPNLAAVHDVGEVDGRVFLAMEYIEGKTLRQEIAGIPLDLAECTRIARSIARALAKAHEKGVVHRDLKPENVMLNEDREVKVLDFGLAKVLESEEPPRESLEVDDTALITAERLLVGTPAYMSPEQATGAKIDARTDLFSFGILLYEMATGVRPFRGETAIEILAAIVRAPQAPASSLNPRVPAALDRIIDQCLQKRREDRFASAKDLLAALEALEAGRPHGSGDVALTPGALLPMTSLDANITKEAALQPRPAAPAWKRLLPLAIVVAAVAALGGIVALSSGPRGAGSRRSTARDPRRPAPGAEKLVTDGDELAREGRRDLACGDYAQASDVDPSYARAALAAMLCHVDAPNEGRPFFRKAWAARATLDERDAALLFALEPVFLREHEDDAETARRLDEARKRFPDDARLHLAMAGSLRRVTDGFRDVVEEIDRSLALDPQQPYALELKADYTAYEGDFPGALAAIDQCLKIAPSAEGCLLERTWIYAEQGECDLVESDARRMLAIDPDNEDGAHVLANALYARGGPLETAREVLRRNWEHLPRERRAQSEREDEIDLAILAGDFTTAEAGARAAWKDVADSTLGADHGRAARRLVELELEMGNARDAADVAKGYLDGRGAWEPSARLDDWALGAEPTPLMLATLVHAGDLSATAYGTELRSTLERWERTIEPPTRSFIWIEAYAVPAETTGEAQAAMAARDRYLPIPPYTPLSLDEAAIGRVYLLAGQTADALATLDRATRSCFPLDYPLEQTRAAALLGRAEEASGDTPAACKAYGIVKARWGTANPRSVTAGDALARAAALDCAK